MEFKINLSLYANEEMVRRDIARYMKTARNNMGLSFPALTTICKANYLHNCAHSLWLLEEKDGNPVMDTFWTGCAIYRIRMTLLDDSVGDRTEILAVSPLLENNYPVIRKKIGAIFFEKRSAMGKSLAKVAYEVGGIAGGTIHGIEQGKVRVTIKNFLKLATYYGFMIDLQQNINI